MITKAEFLVSATKWKDCPEPNKLEYAFIGRSNVGKSSLINMLCDHKGLAKTSASPGKTQLINTFLINDTWYLTDLPGYGYAKVSRSKRIEFEKMINNYLLSRENLVNVFVLIDIRHKPQQNDLDFIEWLGLNDVAFSIIFTKADKVKGNGLDRNIALYKEELLKTWADLPELFISSATSKLGKKEIIGYIHGLNVSLKDHFKPE